jgi:hypothetical protein
VVLKQLSMPLREKESKKLSCLKKERKEGEDGRS